MPMYEYHCLDCHKQFDLLRSYDKRDTAVVCPWCESVRAKRVVSSIAMLSPLNSDTVPASMRSAQGGGGCGCGGNCACGGH